MNTKTSAKLAPQSRSQQVNTAETSRIRSCVGNKIKVSKPVSKSVSKPQQKSAQKKQSENAGFDFVGLAG